MGFEVCGHLVDQFRWNQGLITLNIDDPVIRAKSQLPSHLFQTVSTTGMVGGGHHHFRTEGGTEPALFLGFGRSGEKEVPDPYYGGDQGFEHVLDLITEASEGLLEHIRERLV